MIRPHSYREEKKKTQIKTDRTPHNQWYPRSHPPPLFFLGPILKGNQAKRPCLGLHERDGSRHGVEARRQVDGNDAVPVVGAKVLKVDVAGMGGWRGVGFSRAPKNKTRPKRRQ